MNRNDSARGAHDTVVTCAKCYDTGMITTVTSDPERGPDGDRFDLDACDCGVPVKSNVIPADDCELDDIPTPADVAREAFHIACFAVEDTFAACNPDPAVHDAFLAAIATAWDAIDMREDHADALVARTPADKLRAALTVLEDALDDLAAYDPDDDCAAALFRDAKAERDVLAAASSMARERFADLLDDHAGWVVLPAWNRGPRVTASLEYRGDLVEGAYSLAETLQAVLTEATAAIHDPHRYAQPLAIWFTTKAGCIQFEDGAWGSQDKEVTL
jgi:hypothetical protein